MILIKHIERTVSSHKDHPDIYEEYSGRTISELAPCGCKSCLYKGYTYKSSDHSWNTLVVEDDSHIVFVESSSGIADFTGGILSSVIGAALTVASGQAQILAFQKASEFLVGFLLPAIGSGFDSGGSGGQDSSNFGFDIKNVFGNNVAVPVLYGETRLGGVVLSSYTTYNTNGDEQLSLVLALSAGEIEAIGNYTSDQDSLTGLDVPDTLIVNDLDASEITDLFVSLRTGSLSQSVMPGFETQVTAYAQNYTLFEDQAFTWNMKEAGHGLDLNIKFPRGLRNVDKVSGDSNSEFVDVQVDIYDIDGVNLISTETRRIIDRKSSNFGRTVTIDLPSYNRYKVVLTKTNADRYLSSNFHFDETIVAAINEKKEFQIAYRGKAVLGVKIKASDQISGGFPKISLICKGRKVYNPVDDVTEYSRNNAWCLRDWLLSKEYGLGNRVSSEDIDSDAFADFAEHCDDLIDAFTDAPIVSLPQAIASNVGTVAPTMSGTWTPADDWGEWGAEVTAVSTGTSVEIEWSYTPDYEANNTPQTFTTTHTGTSAEVVAYGMSAVANPGQTWSVGDVWTFRVLKEPRHRLDLYIDGQGSIYEIGQSMARAGRAVLFMIGSQHTVDIQRQKPINGGVFSEGANVKESSVTRTTESPLSRFNVVEVSFVDRDLDYETDKVVLETEGVSSGLYEEQRFQSRIIGVTRRTEANRLAAFYRRVQLYQRESVKFTGMIDSVTLVPGEVLKMNTEEDITGYSGRIVGYTASSITIDKPDGIPLYAGRVYTYTERQSDNTVSSVDFTVSSDTTATTIDVEPFDTDPTGNPYVIGERGINSTLYVCASVGSVTNDLDRDINGVIYTDDIFSYDAPIVATSFAGPEIGDPPANVTSLSVSEDVNNGKSDLTVSWTASAGVPAATRYRVYSKVFGGDYVFVSETTGTSIVDTVVYETGRPITYAVQPVASDGARNPLTSVSTVTYVIRRKGNILITYPDPVIVAAITAGAGNSATLSWDAVSDVDGYEVRYGSWHEGILLYRGTSLSVALTLNNLSQSYYIRTYNTFSGERFYSGNVYKVDSTPTNYSTYTTEEETDFFDFESEGTIQNGTSIEWQEYDSDKGVLQTIPYLETRYTSSVVDLGSSSNTHVSTDIRIVPYQIGSYGDLSMAMLDRSFYGEINKTYLTFQTILEYSNDGINYASGRIDENVNDNIVVSARYFRFVLRVKSLRQADFETNEFPCLGLVERLKYSLYR